MCVGWHPTGPASLPTTPEEGKAGWAWWVEPPSCWSVAPPVPSERGGDSWQGGSQGAGGELLT
jgi:hypothetical protein